MLLALGDFMNVQCHCCIGGKSVGEDIRRLDYGVQVVSGTPGRVFDMIRRRNLRTQSLQMLVIDEADEMLNKGFKDQIYDIYRYLPPSTQVVLISATMPQEVLDMTRKFMNDPVKGREGFGRAVGTGQNCVCVCFCGRMFLLMKWIKAIPCPALSRVEKIYLRSSASFH